ncbi:MAG: NUDIX domain-containing protein [Novosphingobium sp.]|uniref:NUDIX domain-containing protein n=1 Tax=Novosphingobium sp. TaxID=1874826 RepID=UPI003B9B55DC
MLSFLPGPIHRIALRAAHGLRLWFWRLTKRKVRGCNVIAANAAGEVLLVRHSYHARDTWMLPGGGLGRSESPLGTAQRELREETGCLLRNPAHLGTVTLDRKGWTNLIELVCGEAEGTPAPDGREIEEARFFAPDALPEKTSGPVRAMIAKWQDQNGSSA